MILGKNYHFPYIALQHTMGKTHKNHRLHTLKITDRKHRNQPFPKTCLTLYQTIPGFYDPEIEAF